MAYRGRRYLARANLCEPAWCWHTAAVIKFQGAKETGQSPHDGPASGCFQCVRSDIDILIIALKICFCYKDRIDALSGAGWSM
jgi:hypothetical protein